MRRVVGPGGLVVVQFATAFGLKNLLNQARRGFRRPRDFEVRYRRVADLIRMCYSEGDDVRVEVDGFFSLNPQSTDLDLLRPRYRLVVHVSEALRKVGIGIPWSKHIADSIFVRVVRGRAA
jgi:hypothetical protein